MTAWLKAWWDLGVVRRAFGRRSIPVQDVPILSQRAFLDELCALWPRRHGEPLKMTLYGHPIERDDIPYLSDEDLSRIEIHGVVLKKRG